MQLIDLSFSAPQQNLTFEETALLSLQETGSNSVLRVWESPRYFVVVGRGQDIEKEVDVEACQRLNIPVLRRCSGGGTVLQGPGCLNYAFILQQSLHPKLKLIQETTRLLLQAVSEALLPLNPHIQIQGISDLTVQGLKFSGNAQRRLSQTLLFHGTLLYAFDLKLIDITLKFPSKSPDYRQDRPHHAFVTNLGVDQASLKKQLQYLASTFDNFLNRDCESFTNLS